MASLNLSANGPSIKSSYQAVVSGGAPPAGSSSTYAQWALFSVQAPLANAFQDSSNKESVLKVQSTGEGELEELIEDFNEGRIQFAFVKVKDPNSGLPKFALIAWCGGGVPERTKGYFTSHVNAVSKVLHGYHVQITARSDADLEPATILQKVSDASGAKYTAGGSAPVTSGGAPPPVKSKPVFASATPGTISFNPLVAARNANLKKKDDDGWGDAPEVSRSEIQKVESAYKPTKVNIEELRSQQQPASRFNPAQREDAPDVVRGAYQPVGKVDIAAIRAAAKNQHDDRPTTVKGAYEPVGKVDIAAIRAKAQKPSEPEPEPAQEPEAAERPKSLAERSAAFSQSERITELPKPKVAKKWGGASSFTGTKPLTPGALGLHGPVATPAAAPVGSASRTFADQGGKTPAQLWAEKKAAQGGSVPPAATSPSPIAPQASGSANGGGGGGWQSGYSGKSWATVQTGSYGRGIPGQKTGDTATSSEPSAPAIESQTSGSIRDRFKEVAPTGVAAVGGAAAGAFAASRATGADEDEDSGPPPPPMGARPPVESSSGAPAGGFALPGMPPRPPPPTDEEEEEPEPSSPIRVAMPVARAPEPEIEPVQEPPVSLPTRTLERAVPKEEDLPTEEESYDPRAASEAVAQEEFGSAPAASSGGKRALIQYDYEKAEDNELELREGEYVENIEMVDEDWWMGTNSRGESGLFPSNYVELVEDANDGPAPPEPPAASRPPPPPAPAAEPEPEPAPAAAGGATATAEFDYEAAEDNELSFPEGATITNVEFPDEDWWFGHYKGDSGLFPANYVKLDQ
ncbi:uncharacterized protein B0I36DRAFT_233945 [Microdochium trichocladiopsis]|uniref:SH3 domain-containing protein n=1 Tax=Microdochium trichocladiopsis TaxID=1682393 RepID=A0A9P8YGT6_9PEZI|nr:uncharacterized protein B0I36DRAFT_233945 [Microdochium trichocladiopsis]KAH7039713.1 hypothetical protein B0I36DRAFT_233945 [Microdochium trichocladiopsis]